MEIEEGDGDGTQPNSVLFTSQMLSARVLNSSRVSWTSLVQPPLLLFCCCVTDSSVYSTVSNPAGKILHGALGFHNWTKTRIHTFLDCFTLKMMNKAITTCNCDVTMMLDQRPQYHPTVKNHCFGNITSRVKKIKIKNVWESKFYNIW